MRRTRVLYILGPLTWNDLTTTTGCFELVRKRSLICALISVSLAICKQARKSARHALGREEERACILMHAGEKGRDCLTERQRWKETISLQSMF